MIKLRKACAADKQAFATVRTLAIIEGCKGSYTQQQIDIWAPAPPPDNFEELLQTRHMVMVEVDGDVVGCGYLHPQIAEIGAMFVRPDFQRRGIGMQILRALEKVAVEIGLREVRITSTPNAVKFYQKAGYALQGAGEYQSRQGVTLACFHLTKPLGVDSQQPPSRASAGS